MNNKKLAIAFAVLLGVFLLIKFLGPGERERSFKKELVSIDTTKVTAILLYPKAENGEEIKFSKENGTWMASKDDLKVSLAENAIGQFVKGFQGLKPKRVVGNKSNWDKYEVTEEKGTRVKVMQGNKAAAELIVGKFTFTQQPQTITSYLRVEGEDKVYAIDGALSMMVNQSFNSFRDRSFLKLNKIDIAKIALRIGEQNIVLSKENAWSGSDSTQVDNYLTRLSNLPGLTFKDGFSPKGTAAATATFEGNNMSAITVNCFAMEGKFICNSSQFPENYFESDSSGIYKQIFELE